MLNLEEYATNLRLMDNWGEPLLKGVPFKKLTFRSKQDKLLRRLNNLLSRLKNNTQFYWPTIFRFLIEHSYRIFEIFRKDGRFLDDLPFLKKYSMIFLDKLLQLGCSDPNLVMRIFKLRALWYSRDYQAVSDAIFDEDHWDYAFVLVFQFCSDLDSDDIYDTKYLSHAHLIQIAMQMKDVKFLTALLKYGVCYIPCETFMNEYPSAVDGLVDFWSAWLKPHGVALGDKFILMNVVDNNGDIGNGNKRGYRRILFQIRMLDILHILRWRHVYWLLEDEQIEDYVRCINLYFRGTVEPLVCNEEIIELIEAAFPGTCNVPENAWDEIRRDVKGLFGEVIAPAYAPRSLKHLSRHAIRCYVIEQRARVLPEVVEGLLIPKSLRSYILCEC